jgi:PAS domain S-box-containing protein
MSVPLPHRLHPGRIAALRRSGILDEPGGAQYAHLVELVRMMLGVPVAIVSIVDEHRQVFAGHSGLPEPWSSRGQTPITHSFCQHVVDRGVALSVSDAYAEPLVRDNMAIPDLGVVAYLGVPIRLPGGELIGALAAIDTAPREWTDHEQRLLESVAVIVDKEIRVGASERRYRTLFEQMREGFYVGDVIRDDDGEVVDFRFDEVNPSFNQLTGLRGVEVNGAQLSHVVPGAGPEILPVFRRIVDEQVPGVHVSRSTLVAGRWFETRMTPLGADRMIGFVSDVTERRTREELQEVLKHEMSHRLKNTLMMVQALATQTLRVVPERAPVEALEERITALSSAHDILFDKNWEGASVEAISRAALGRLCIDRRIAFRGPPVEMGPKATLSLSLLLHELATNALKYGALSNTEGHVELGWAQEAGDFLMTWREVGGPAVMLPSRKGFGSKLIAMGLGAGSVRTEYLAEGLLLQLSAPMSHLQQA